MASLQTTPISVSINGLPVGATVRWQLGDTGSSGAIDSNDNPLPITSANSGALFPGNGNRLDLTITVGSDIYSVLGGIVVTVNP